MRLISVLVFLFCNCLNTGCLNSMDALKLAGFSNPKIKVTKNIFGFSAEAGTDLNGTIDVTYNPETGTITLKGSVNSNAANVVTAEGERADHIAAMQIEQMKQVTERHRIVGENMKAAGQMMALAATAGGDALSKVIDATAPILAGSAIDINGIGSAQLGAMIDGTWKPKLVPPATGAIPVTP